MAINTFVPNKYAILENTKLFARNFDGLDIRRGIKKYKNDVKGKRYATIDIPTQEQADAMFQDGWNVKTLVGNEQYPEPRHFVKANINYNTKNPPKIYLVQEGQAPVLLDEGSLAAIQDAYIKNVDCSLRLAWLKDYNCYAAYVNEMYLTIEKVNNYNGYFDSKYDMSF